MQRTLEVSQANPAPPLNQDRRLKLIEELRQMLAQSGFFISDVGPERNICFDLVARRDGLLLLVKVLTNVDSFSPDAARELRTLAHYMEASPLLVGTHSGAGKLEDGVLYTRHHVYLVNPVTFKDQAQEDVPPYMRSAPGGTFVDLFPNALEKAMAEQNLSLGSLANAAGVARRTIQHYLEGMAATVEVALRLEDFIQEELIQPQKMLSRVDGDELQRINLAVLDRFSRHLLLRLQQLGYEVTPTQRSPFTALAGDQSLSASQAVLPHSGSDTSPLAALPKDQPEPRDQEVLLTMVAKDKLPAERARRFTTLREVLEREGVILVNESELDSLEGTPVIRRKELAKTEGSEEVYELIEERRG